jgi:2,4-dienoyl-CoA reductase-like NADH-dependent reductase (Old Yellow Enzyme family)
MNGSSKKGADGNFQGAFGPARIGGLELRNRIVRTAAFEGMTPEGRVSDDLVEHHRRMAQGGVGMTTVAYCSVSPLGLTFGDQMQMRPELVGPLRRLTDAVHRQGAAACLQLGHAGYFADKKVIGRSPLGASRLFNLYGLALAREMSVDEILRTVEEFGRAARLAKEAGLDAVELHYGHGYLVSQFLSPFTNRRRDEWGGDLEGRLKLPVEILRRVREEVGEDFPLVVKMNLSDGFKRGLQVGEAVEVARRLEREGADALFLSGGFVSKTPFYMLRGDVPVKEMARHQRKLVQRLGLKLFGHVFVQTYPITDLFFLEGAREVRRAVDLPLVLVGGVRSREGIGRAMAEGFDFVAMGRPLIIDPSFPKKLERGEVERSECDYCNRCVAEMEDGGVRCVTIEELREQGGEG